jgi:hypothetical protein
VRICKVGKPATTQAHLSFATILVISELHNHRVQEFKILFPDIESFEQVRLTAKPVSKTCTAMSAHTHTPTRTPSIVRHTFICKEIGVLQVLNYCEIPFFQ